MRKLALMAIGSLLATPVAALAETVTGPYVSLGAGYNILQDEFLHTDPLTSGIPSGQYNNSGSSARYRWGDGFNSQVSLGYGLGNGFRFELEGFYQ